MSGAWRVKLLSLGYQNYLSLFFLLFSRYPFLSFLDRLQGSRIFLRVRGATQQGHSKGPDAELAAVITNVKLA